MAKIKAKTNSNTYILKNNEHDYPNSFCHCSVDKSHRNLYLGV